MKGLTINRCLPWVLAAMVLISGCSGVLLEKKDNAGQVDRIKIGGTESWDSYDDRPRHPFTNSKKRGMDDMGILLKSETNF